MQHLIQRNNKLNQKLKKGKQFADACGKFLLKQSCFSKSDGKTR